MQTLSETLKNIAKMVNNKYRAAVSAALLIVHFSGGSEDGSPRNKKPPAMPVRLSVFRSKQKNYLNVV